MILSIDPLLLVALRRMEGPSVNITMTTEQEILVERNGRNVKRRVPTSTVSPGSELIYCIKLVNEGDSTAKNVVVDNPVPDGATYIAGSATGKGSKPVISIDHGKTYSPEHKTSTIEPGSVTDVRWLVDKMPAGSKRQLEFKVKVEDAEKKTIAAYWTAIYLWLLAMFSR